MRDVSKLGLTRFDDRAPKFATAAAIARFERAFRVTLPADYRAFLMTQNGGCPRVNRVRFGRRSATTVNTFFFLGRPRAKPPRLERGWDDENLWDETFVARRQLGERVVPFAADPFGDYFFFDYRRPGPRVAIALHEDGFKFLTVARSFSDFLDKLERPPRVRATGRGKVLPGGQATAGGAVGVSEVIARNS
jgi:hypothetical protein